MMHAVPQVTTSCSGRFWVFDQARQLHRHQMLRLLINDYPRFLTQRWGLPDKKVESLLLNGVYARFFNRIQHSLPPGVRDHVARSVHDNFSRRLARHLPQDTDIFIGLSSFCLEALQRARETGAITIVDHGSLHQAVERRLLQEEVALHGVRGDTELAADWIIEKEDREFHAADRVLVLSGAARRSLVAQGIPAGKIFVNACGVDLSSFRVTPRRDDTFRVIYCGNLSLRKGVHYLLQAFSELGLRDAELLLVGSKPHPVYARFIKRFQAPNVRFLGAFPQRELQKIYATGSVFVLPSVADGFGMVVPQAMACGLPVVVTENVGAADVVTHGHDGFVLPVRDVEALKSHLQQLYENPARAAAMGRAAAESAQRLSWDAYGERLVKYLEECWRGRHTGAGSWYPSRSLVTGGTAT